MFKIASPCSEHWSEFKGDSKIRHCDLCDRDVNNVCKMSKAERQVLLDKVAGGQRVCIYIEPPFLNRAAYFMFAVIMCMLGRVGYKAMSGKLNPSDGVMMGVVLDDSKFSDFGKIDQ